MTKDYTYGDIREAKYMDLAIIPVSDVSSQFCNYVIKLIEQIENRKRARRAKDQSSFEYASKLILGDLLIARTKDNADESLSQSERLAQLSELMKPASVVFIKLCYSGIILAILIALIVLSNLALNSPWGRKVRAIRDNEVAASAMGKNIKRQHLQIFVIGSAIVGIAGALLVTYDGIFIPTGYQPLRFTFLIWVMVIVGGSGNNLGSVLGAFIIWFMWIQSGPIGLWVVEMIGSNMQEGSSSLEFIEDRVHYLRLVFMGSIMLVIMRFSPGGILPEKNKEL